MNPVLDLSPVPSLLENDLVPGPSGGIPLRWYRPSSDATLLPVTVSFHGGGWTVDDLDNHDHLCRRLARRSQAVVVSVDYRRARRSRPGRPISLLPQRAGDFLIYRFSASRTRCTINSRRAQAVWGWLMAKGRKSHLANIKQCSSVSAVIFAER